MSILIIMLSIYNLTTFFYNTDHLNDNNVRSSSLNKKLPPNLPATPPINSAIEQK